MENIFHQRLKKIFFSGFFFGRKKIREKNLFPEFIFSSFLIVVSYSWHIELQSFLLNFDKRAACFLV